MSRLSRCDLLWSVPSLGPRSASELRGRERAIVDAFVALERVTCCSFQLGFYIDIDGTPWSDESTTDEPSMTWTWLPALVALLSGEGATHATPWEESALTLVSDGELVVMEDVHGSGQISMRRVAVPLRDLAARMHVELVDMAVILRAVRDEASARLGLATGPDAEKLGCILQEVPDESARGLGAIDLLGRALAAS